MQNDIYSFSVKTINGTMQTLKDFEGKVLLVVNVASRCGFTPQYTGLEKLYKTYHEQGLEILAFPCNQFGAQEPGSDDEVLQFCQSTYDVSFPLYSKIDVNGPQENPLYGYLKHAAPGLLGTEGIKWNFTKFLIDRQGKVVGRFAPQVTPDELEAKIKTLLVS